MDEKIQKTQVKAGVEKPRKKYKLTEAGKKAEFETVVICHEYKTGLQHALGVKLSNGYTKELRPTQSELGLIFDFPKDHKFTARLIERKQKDSDETFIVLDILLDPSYDFHFMGARDDKYKNQCVINGADNITLLRHGLICEA